MIDLLPPAPAGWFPPTRRRLTVDEIAYMGGYTVIYADPSWSYADKNCSGAAEQIYRSASFEDMASMPVSRIAAPDAALFMWATYPKLDEALALIKCWGFTFKSIAFQWVKYRASGPFFGLGRWTRGNTEPCLLATRGKPHRQDVSVAQLLMEDLDGIDPWASEGGVLHAPLTRHSAKPPEVRQRIVRLMGNVPRIELFARERADGFDAWGDQIDSDIVMQCGRF